MRPIKPVVSRVERSPRQPGLPKTPLPRAGEGRVGATSCPRKSPIHKTSGPAGEALNEGTQEDATAAWLAHVRAGQDGE